MRDGWDLREVRESWGREAEFEAPPVCEDREAVYGRVDVEVGGREGFACCVAEVHELWSELLGAFDDGFGGGDGTCEEA